MVILTRIEGVVNATSVDRGESGVLSQAEVWRHDPSSHVVDSIDIESAVVNS